MAKAIERRLSDDGVHWETVVVDENGGGGGTPAGADGQVQFNDGGAFGASPDFTFATAPGESTIGLESGENSVARIAALGAGTQVHVTAADGSGVSAPVGGEIVIEAGAGDDNGDGGAVTLKAGTAGADSDGGALAIYSGQASGGTSGEIQIKSGGTGESNRGGQILIQAGTGQTQSGGSVIIQAGPKTTGGNHGTVQIYSANGSHFIELSETAGFQFFGGTIVFDGLPTADPANAGQLWNDGGTLKVSAG